MMEVAKTIVRIYCDEPMARSKGLLGKCRGDCRGCFCAIEVESNGESAHVNPCSSARKRYIGEAARDESKKNGKSKRSVEE